MKRTRTRLLARLCAAALAVAVLPVAALWRQAADTDKEEKR